MRRPATWAQWQDWAKKERKRTPWSFVQDVLAPRHPKFFSAEEFYRSSLDQKIRRYAGRPVRWPRMDVIERALLYYRFESAESLLKVLAHSILPPPPAERFAETVEWLLVTSWLWHGLPRWTEFRWWGERATQVQVPAADRSPPDDGFAA